MNYLCNNMSIFVYYPICCFVTDSHYAVLLAPHYDLACYFPRDHVMTSFYLEPWLLLASIIRTVAFVAFPTSQI